MSGFKVKACGNTRAEDVKTADEAGADFVGVVAEVDSSPRSVGAKQAREILGAAKKAQRALLLLNPPRDRLRELVDTILPDVVHLVGEEDPQMLEDLKTYFSGKIFKSIHLPPAGEEEPPLDKAIRLIKKYADTGADAVVVDTRDASRGMFGGTGKVSDWKAAAEITASSPLPVFLAGGISIDNVEEALRDVCPYGVDLASGLECEVGKKDAEIVRAFIKKVHNYTSGR